SPVHATARKTRFVGRETPRLVRTDATLFLLPGASARAFPGYRVQMRGATEGRPMGEILNLRRGMAQLGALAPLVHRASTEGASFDPRALLLADIAMGNERAFARLYELTGSRLLAIARGIVGRTDVAEDVLQDSFLRVWRWAHRYDPAKGVAYAW